VAVALALAVAGVTPAFADEPAPAAAESQTAGRTPPRLSFLDGAVSYWRPGAEDWVPAQINTPLAPGDALYTGSAANLELQIGPRAFVRAGEETQLGLENQEADFLQLKITSGHASLDLRSLTAGHTVELDAPNAAFTIETSGYYRVDVSDGTTTFIARRGGRATMIPAGGAPVAIAPSEQVVVEGADTPHVETYAAAEVDAWDRWNYDRTDDLIDAVSARYVSSGVYGIDNLDQYGDWRVVPDYGSVWVPDGVGPTWAPYSTGRWIWDPYYGWTWVDSAPWGWAPYHYGRWVHLNRCWAWAPGPRVVRPVYAPALVTFFGGGGFGVRLGFGTPAIGWCALGWGEPLVPWWGRPGFIGHPWWAGWGGPHVVNNVVVNRTTIVNVNKINVFQNAHMPHAFVAVDRNRFGHGVHARLQGIDPQHFAPFHGALPVKPSGASLVPAVGHARRPPQTLLKTSVVATRAPHDSLASLRAQGLQPQHAVTAPAPRLVPALQRPHTALPSRPPFGQTSSVERQRPPMPSRFEGTWHPEAQAPQARRPGGRSAAAPPFYHLGPSGSDAEAPRGRAAPRGPAAPSAGAPAPRFEAPRPAPRSVEVPGAVAPLPRVAAPGAVAPPPRVEMPRPQAPEPPRAPQRELPGEPANRVFPGRAEAQPPRFSAPAPPAHAPHAGPGVRGGGPHSGGAYSGGPQSGSAYRGGPHGGGLQSGGFPGGASPGGASPGGGSWGGGSRGGSAR
jgi:hypothetical protein